MFASTSITDKHFDLPLEHFPLILQWYEYVRWNFASNKTSALAVRNVAFDLLDFPCAGRLVDIHQYLKTEPGWGMPETQSVQFRVPKTATNASGQKKVKSTVFFTDTLGSVLKRKLEFVGKPFSDSQKASRLYFDAVHNCILYEAQYVQLRPVLVKNSSSFDWVGHDYVVLLICLQISVPLILFLVHIITTT